MNVLVEKKVETSLSIISAVTINGESAPRYYVLEPARVAPVHDGHPCIPAGAYEMALLPSAKHCPPEYPERIPHVLDVPGRTEIEWHVGNFPKDTLGCALVGKSYTTDMVTSSVLAFRDFMEEALEAIAAGEKITVEYRR